jgi:hypothetical protein
MIECSDKVTGAMVNGTGSFVPPSSGACPARVPPRAAGLQAALAGAAGPAAGAGAAGGVAPKGL